MKLLRPTPTVIHFESAVSEVVSGNRPRHEVSVQDTWDLALLFPNDESWEKDFGRYQELYPKIVDYKGTLAKGVQEIKKCLEFDRDLDRLAEKLYHYVSLKTSQDQGNSHYQGLDSRFMQTSTRAAELASFLTPEIQAIPDPVFESYVNSPELAEWKITLQKIRRFKPHILSEPEEKLLAMSSDALRASEEVFEKLNNVDLNFGEIEDENGRKMSLTHGSFMSFLVKPRRDLRERAFRQYYKEFAEHSQTLSTTLAWSVKRDVFHARSRNYPSALEASLFRDDVPLSLYNNLVDAVKSNLSGLFEYFELRRKVLNLPDIHHYDTYVPLVSEIKTNYSFDQACSMVLESLSPMGSEYVNTLANGFKSRWVDKYENKGKRSGAFSSSSYLAAPYILMNYKSDVFSDVYTLAHEAGHSMHSYYSMHYQPYQLYNYTIFVAEVASTFNEQLLTHYLLSKWTDPRQRAYLLSKQLDAIRGTIIRQTMFAEFEKIIHAMEEANEPLTLDSLRQEYRKLLNVYFGKDFTIDNELELEGLRIPHFYHAFYVYKYATGLSAAIALADRVINKAPGALESYFCFLKGGCSKFPLQLLQDAGVDMTRPEPVEAALNLFKRYTAELKELLKK